MSEVREIVTRAVLAKGRKTFRICETITPDNPPYSVLGCWVINHEFEATQNEKQVELFGNFEINIWYAYDNNCDAKNHFQQTSICVFQQKDSRNAARHDQSG